MIKSVTHKMMKAKIFFLTAVLFAAFNAQAQFEDPFKFTTEVKGSKLSVSFIVPDKLYLYEDQTGVMIEETKLLPASKPETVEKKDPQSGEKIHVYDKSFTLKYQLPSPAPDSVTLFYAGCDDAQCYIPQTKEITLQPASVQEVEPAAAETTEQEAGKESLFKVTGFKVGFMSSRSFISFLNEVETGAESSDFNLNKILDDYGPIVMVLLVMLAGLGLNLTPCVLPMIPVNIAIIGAGAQAGSKARGFALGAVYGLGIAIAYGALGLLFVLAGANFGTLNASPSFNITIGLIFLLLALAMFGVFNIDLTRFQGKLGAGGEKGSFFTAFFLGAIAALLAGACVAPAIFSTLIFALDVYNKGNPLGLALPFLLGIGMALPWPFAGAGLSFLPKAGGWMEKVKYVFGVIIIAAAVYYIGLGASLLNVNEPEKAETEWLNSIEDGKKAALEEDKPIFLDFWASWCKNCTQMDKTTFKDAKVIQRLDSYIKVKYDATDPNGPGVKETLEKYNVRGLPSFVILQHEK